MTDTRETRTKQDTCVMGLTQCNCYPSHTVINGFLVFLPDNTSSLFREMSRFLNHEAVMFQQWRRLQRILHPHVVKKFITNQYFCYQRGFCHFAKNEIPWSLSISSVTPEKCNQGMGGGYTIRNGPKYFDIYANIP